jgi:hypothetical protein
MSERRRVHRREPIEVEFDNGRVVVVSPLPWLQRNDMGDEIIVQFAELTNRAVSVFVDPETNLPKLEAVLGEKLVDYQKILAMCVPDEDCSTLDYSEVLELIYASLEVNGLENLRRLVDPNFRSPMMIGETPISEGEPSILSGQRTESTTDSSSEESVPTLSNT